MTPRLSAGAGVLLLLAVAACSTDPVSPPQDATNPYGVTVVHRGVERLDPAAEDWSRSFALPADELPDPTEVGAFRSKGAVAKGNVVFRGVATLSPPVLDGQTLQITDIQIDGKGRDRCALAVANVAGEMARGALQIYDLRDPMNAALYAEALLADAEYNAVVPDRDVVYALGNDLESAIVDVYDISDRRQPVLVHRLSLGAFTAVAGSVDHRVLYVVTGDNGGLHRFDLSDPLAPAAIDFVAVADARDVVVGKRHLLVLDGEGVVEIVDGAAAARIAVSGLPERAPSRAAATKKAWYINTTSGIASIDLKTLEPRHAAGPGLGTPNGLASNEDRYFFRANGEGGLQVLYDARKRDSQLAELGLLDFANGGSSNSVAAADGFLLSGDGRGGVLVCQMEEDILDDD